MNVQTILDTLDGLGVQVTVTAEGRVRLEPAGLVDPALLGEVRAYKTELLAHLRRRASGGGVLAALAPLPRPLVALVQAAKVNNLNRSGFLPSGIVPNLGDYVLTCAALYACDFDAPQQLAHLWAARAAAAS